VRVLLRRRPNVGKLARKGRVFLLREAVRYQERVVDGEGVEWDVGAPVRLEAAQRLATFEGPIVEEGLAEVLADEHRAVRRAAVEAIAERQAPTAVEQLIDGLVKWTRPEDAETARMALDTLAGWRLDGLADLLAEKLLQSEAPPLEDAQLDAFSRLLAADPDSDAAAAAIASRLIASGQLPSAPDRADRTERLLGRLGPGAIDPLLRAMRGRHARPGAVRALGLLRDGRAVDPLISLLRDPSPPLREAAAEALGNLNDTRAVPGLVACTQDPEQSVRDAASAALERMGPAAVIVAVVTLLQPRNGELEPSIDGPRALEQAVTQLISRGETADIPAPAQATAAEVPPEPTAPESSGRLATRRSRLLNVLQSALDPNGPDGAGRHPSQ
jgi:HEAT repeat protein